MIAASHPVSLLEFGPPLNALAKKTDELLTTLAGELEARNHPHRLARRSLGVNRFGGTSVAYNDEAFSIWKALLARDPSDFQALHHLGIMHHARAVELEVGPDPPASNPDWEAGLRYWTQLWQCDAFWADLAGRAWGERQVLHAQEVRDAWPRELLQFHYDIAFDPATAPSRAPYHIKLAQGSAFSEPVKQEAQDRAYAGFVNTVDSSVWQSEILSPELIHSGLQRIYQFLRLDPECVAAISDALRLQNRFLNAWKQELAALGDDEPGRTRIFTTVKDAAAQWAPYLQQLRHLVCRGTTDLRAKLRLWYRDMGDVYRALDKYPDAVRFYEQAQQVSFDATDQRELAQRICEVQALEAREYATSAEPEDCAWGKKLCDRLVREAGPDFSVAACFVLANAYQLLDEFEAAEALCERGLAIEPEVDDLASFDHYRGLLRDVQEKAAEGRRRARLRVLMEEAEAALARGEFESAVPKLERALQVSPDLPLAHIHLCKCHLELLAPTEARQHAEAFRHLAETAREDERPVMFERVAEMEEACQSLAEQVEAFSAGGLRLRRSVTQELQGRNLKGAEQLLREIMTLASPRGQELLKPELARVLTDRAVQEVDGLQRRSFVEQADQTAAFEHACKWLEEAARLCPNNTRVTQHLNTVRMKLQRTTAQ